MLGVVKKKSLRLFIFYVLQEKKLVHKYPLSEKLERVFIGYVSKTKERKRNECYVRK